MLHTNTKIIAVTGVLLLVLSAGACAYFFHMVTEQKALLQSKVVEKAVMKSHQESLDTLLDTLASSKTYRESLISRIFHEEEVIDFLALVESIGREQGVALKTDSLIIEPVNEVFEKLVISISVEGSYASVTQVLKIFELLPYQSLIRKATIGRDMKKENESVDAWKGSFELSVTKFKKI